MIMEIRLGDVVRLRKVHPCGGYDWEVVRLGADIGIRLPHLRPPRPAGPQRVREAREDVRVPGPGGLGIAYTGMNFRYEPTSATS